MIEAILFVVALAVLYVWRARDRKPRKSPRVLDLTPLIKTKFKKGKS